jgi:predicted ATPase
MVYQILKSLNKIPYYAKDQIKRFVEFVDIVDDL